MGHVTELWVSSKCFCWKTGVAVIKMQGGGDCKKESQDLNFVSVKLKIPVCQVLRGGHRGRGLQDLLSGGILLFFLLFICVCIYFRLNVLSVGS